MNTSNRLSSALRALVLLALVLPLAAAPAWAQADPPAVYMNEIQVSTSGTDWEFVELQGAPGTPLSGLALIGVESDDGSSAGTIDRVIDLAGQSIPADGFWLGISPAGAAAYGVSGEMAIADNTFENSTATYFLVAGFTGSQGDDLDTDNDGVLDVTPWSAVLDALNIRDSGASDFDYGAPSVGPDGYYLPSGAYRCPDAPDGAFDDNMLDFGSPDGTPGESNHCGGGPVEACGDPYTAIYEVQGSGSASPLEGSEVSVEGVVVGDFQPDAQLRGFYLQDPGGDGLPATSDGVFVYAPGSLDVAPGDRVRIVGQVDEYYGMTQITNVSDVLWCSSGHTVAPTPLTLPVADVSDFEPVEGMLVRFAGPLYIAEYYNFDRYGEIVLAASRQIQPTALYEPGSPQAAQLALDNALARIKLDDGRTSQNPDPALHPNGLVFDLGNTFRGGDRVENLTGVIDYRYSEYRLQPTQGADFYPQNPRTAAPDEVGGGLKVASLNVLNYFTTLGSRGADTPQELERQRAKIVSALAAMDADVVGLIEIENNDAALADLVGALNAALGAGTYASIDTGAIGTDEIKQAILYRPAAVSPLGAYAVLDDPAFVNPITPDPQNRPALAQSFIDNQTGGILTVVVNHLKSKGSPCGEGDDDPEAGSCNLTRALAAQALADWLAADPTGSGDGDVLILGDLNSYDKEDPIDVLAAAGYTDLLLSELGEAAYSYVFDGQLGYLDYAMPNQSLLPQVAGATIWHINADEPDILDYDMTYKQDAQDALYEPNAYRASDHDPVIVGLDVCDEIPPALAVSVTPDVLWPPNHKYVIVRAEATVSDNFDLYPALTLVSVTSNEPDEGLGDGDTANDIVIVDDLTVKLRAERSGSGEGRVYTLTYRAADACGNETEATATVTVPHSLKK